MVALDSFDGDGAFTPERAAMNAKRIIARNAAWNWVGIATHMLVGLFISPFLVHQLGDKTYGLWIVIASLSGYFGVLDLGVGGSVGRNVAFFRARNDLAGVNGILNTAFFYLCSVAVFSLIATLGALLLFFVIIDVEPGHVEAARFALLLVGLNFALGLPLQSFDGILWAYQRFDLQNGIDIPTVLLRAGLTYWFVGHGYGLVALAAITFLTSLAGLVAKAALALGLEPGLRVRFAFVNRESARGLFGYGIWYFLFSLFKNLGAQVVVMIVGSRLGTALVTPFTVALALIRYANQFLIAGSGVLTPVATAMHARDEHEAQRCLFVAGGRGCLAMALLFFSLFAFLGRPLLRLWMGPALEHAHLYLLILAAGELLPMSQHITLSMILGKGRLGVLAGSGLVEIGVTSLAAFGLASYGLESVCWAVALPALVCRGIAPLVYACTKLGVRLGGYTVRVFLPTLLVAAGPILLLGLVSKWWTPGTWPELFLCGGAYAVLYVGIVAIGLFAAEIKRGLGTFSGDADHVSFADKLSANPGVR
jgi:O-antigen/teichoic acid export membrane protein